MRLNQHILTPIKGSAGLTGIYRNKYGSQEVIGAYIGDLGVLYERHHLINQFDWTDWKPVHNLADIDTFIIRELLDDDYRFNFKEGTLNG